MMVLHQESNIGAPNLQFELSIPSTVSSISPLVDDLMERLVTNACIQGDGSDIEVALREALANGILHGNHEDPAKRVYLKVRYEKSGELFFVVRDEGKGFNLSEVADPLAPENLASEHGRGILMMKLYMDDVHYEHGGTEVHMRKKILAGM